MDLNFLNIRLEFRELDYENPEMENIMKKRKQASKFHIFLDMVAPMN